MKNKKIITLLSLLVSVLIHSLIFSIPAYLYYIKYGKINKNSYINMENKIFSIETTMLPDIKDIGDKTSIKKTLNKQEYAEKKEEDGDNKSSSLSLTSIEEADSEMLVIYDYIKRKIQENKKYPYQAKKDKIEGVVEIQFLIDKNGFLKDANIINSSGYKILDEEALATIKRAQPYPAIPDRFNTDNTQLQLKMIYKIE